MQHLVNIYEENQVQIERFITSSLIRLETERQNLDDIKKMFKLFPSLELFYITDDKFTQVSPNYKRNNDIDEVHRGVKREYLVYNRNGKKRELKRIDFKEPYLSTTTGSLCITAIKNTGTGYIFLDFEVEKLLNRFNLIETNKLVEKMNHYFYTSISLALILLGIFLSIFGLYEFGELVIFGDKIKLEAFFKPVIALTLGLAIFDLGKTVLEQEVLNDNPISTETFKPKTLLNFSVSIIIALMIEALLVVFKISLNDHKDLIHAGYLIGATSFLLLVFSVFIYLHNKTQQSKNAFNKHNNLNTKEEK
jgi:hypothetical protein